MSRADRRKAGNTGKVKTYVMTQEQIDQMKKDATLEAFKMLQSIPLMVLHDKFGFGHIRSDRYMHYALIWCEEVLDGNTSLNEIMKIVEDDSGVKVLDY